MTDGWAFAQIPIALLLSDEVSQSAKVYYGYLAWRQGTDDVCWPSDARAAQDLGLSRRHVVRVTAELKEAGWITIEQRPGFANRYTVHNEPVPRMSYPYDKDVLSPCDKDVLHDDIHLDDKKERETSSQILATPGDGIGPPAESTEDLWAQIEATERPERRITPLSPQTPEEVMLFERLRNNARAVGRPGPVRFPTLECRDKFRRVAERLNSQYPAMLDVLLEQGIVKITSAVNYLGGCAKRLDKERAQQRGDYTIKVTP